MAWVRPTKWFGGETPTAAKWNQELRDNMNAHGKDKPYFDGTAKASNTLVSGTALPITWDTVQDPYTMKSATFQSRISAPAGWPGLYFVNANAAFSANGTGFRRLQIKTTRTTPSSGIISSQITSNTYPFQQHWMTISGFVLLNATTDYITLEAWQNSGSNMTLNNYNALTVMYVGESEWAV